jgi:hypothetical protein
MNGATFFDSIIDGACYYERENVDTHCFCVFDGCPHSPPAAATQKCLEKMGVHVLFPNLLGLTQVSLVVGFCFSRVVATARLNRTTWTALAHNQLHLQPVKAAGIAMT